MKKSLLLLFFTLVFTIVANAAEQTMYWIGGAGNWNDLLHWSFQSGSLGATQPSSIPTTETNVIFDAGSGLSGTGTAATRTVNVAAEYVIKSLTFDAGLTNTTTNPIVINRGNYHMRVSGNVTLQPGVTINSGDAYYLVMEAAAGVTTTLTANGHNLGFHFYKQGEGTTDVIGVRNSSARFNANNGILNYSGTTFMAGNMDILGDAIVNFSNVTTATVTGTMNLWNTSQTNFPQLLTFTGGSGINAGRLATNNTAAIAFPLLQTYLGYSITLNATAPIEFPSLQTMTLNTMYGGNANATLVLPATGAVVTAQTWLYAGNITAGQTEFRILNGQFTSKNGSIIHKVIIQNPSTARADIYGASTINELTFINAPGYFRNTMTVGTLTLAPSVDNVFALNTTLSITNGIIDTTPDCTTYYGLGSESVSGTASISNNTGAPINLKNARIARMKALGASPINVFGIDVELNTGFNFIEPASKTIYWVGAAGNNLWNDQANWSGTSGGPGGFCLPTQYDDVIFDANSVITANINTTGQAFFRDITIQDDVPQATFTFTGAIMNCYGSWYMKSGVSFSATASVLFYPPAASMGVNAETITSNGSRFSNVYVRGLGEVRFEDAFYTTGELYFNSGTINTNSQDVYITAQFRGTETLYPTAANGGYRALKLGASVISVDSYWYYNASGTVDAGTSHIIIRNASASGASRFYVLNGQVYYDVTKEETSGTFEIQGNLTFHNLVTKAKTNNITGTLTANLIEASMSSAIAGVQSLSFVQNVTVNTIDLSANAIVTVTNGRTFTVNQNFITHTPDCSGLMVLQSSNSTTGFANLIYNGATPLTIPNVWMKGIHVAGTGSPFTAIGLDDGNNTGWTFVTPAAKELYWIGVADNNWNNGLNWTTNDDGTPTAGGCVPTKYDNVHFNAFSASNLPIHILDQPAYFNNLIGHDDMPTGLTITYPSASPMWAYAYGDLIRMPNGMTISQLALNGGSSTSQLLSTNNNARIGNLTVNNAAASWNFNGNLNVTGTYSQAAATKVAMNMDTYTGGNVGISAGDLDMNITTATTNAFTVNTTGTVKLNLRTLNVVSNHFTFQKGNLIASGITANIGMSFASNTSLARTLDISNSTFNIGTLWNYTGGGSSAPLTSGSRINVVQDFSGTSGHTYNIIATTGGTTADNRVINGNLTINELILNHSRTLNGSNTIGKLTLMPKGLTLRLAANSTQTVTDDLLLNGTPCAINIVRAGTEAGTTQVSATATINYANPNDHNTYDYVSIGGINATNADLNFDVNSTSYGLNNAKVVFLSGAPGLVGLESGFTCRTIDPSDSETYSISAEAFYGGPLSTYTWYKKNGSGTYVQLSVPLTTVAIDVRDHGLDGTYKCVIVYDATVTPIASQCTANDEITVSYTPMNVTFIGDVTSYDATYCADENKKVSDLPALFSATTSSTVATNPITVHWFSEETGGTEITDLSTVLVTGNYYMSLTKTIWSCTSPVRSKVAVTINEVPTVVTHDQAACSPSNVDLTTASVTSGSTPGLIFTYYTDSSCTTALSNPDAVTTSGTYYLKGTNPTTGCIGVATVTVTITNTPAIPILNEVTQPTCLTAAGSFTITNYNVAYTYSVSPSTGVTISGNTVTAPAGTYTVTATQGSCTSVASSSVTVNAQPATPFLSIDPASQTICSGATATLTASGTNLGTVSWSSDYFGIIGTGTSITSGVLTNKGTAPLVVIVKAVADNGNCTAQTNATVTVLPEPRVIVLPGSLEVCSSETPYLMLKSVLAGTTINWSIIDNGNSQTVASGSGTDSVVISNKLPSGSYTIKATGTKDGCTSAFTNVPVLVNIDK